MGNTFTAPGVWAKVDGTFPFSVTLLVKSLIREVALHPAVPVLRFVLEGEPETQVGFSFETLLTDLGLTFVGPHGHAWIWV